MEIAMRVTNNMMASNYIRYIHQQAEELLITQGKIASEKRLNRPSDDPIGMGQVLGYRTTVASIDQYLKNIEQGKTRLQFNDQTLDFVTDLVDNARQLAEANSGPDTTAPARQVAAEHVKEIYDQVMQLANSKFGGNYIFAGHQTDTMPFTRDAGYNATYNGDDGNFQVIVSENTTVGIDADGRNIFQNAASGGVNIFDHLRDLINGLENSDLVAGSAQIQAAVDPLFQGRQQVNDKRAEYGPQLYRLDVTENHWNNFKPKVQEAMEGLEAADIPRAIMELKTLETAYETTMAAAARIIQPGLINFLK